MYSPSVCVCVCVRVCVCVCVCVFPHDTESDMTILGMKKEVKEGHGQEDDQGSDGGRGGGGNELREGAVWGDRDVGREGVAE